MLRRILTIIGFVFLAIGVMGFVAPGLLAMHLSVSHNVIHIVSGLAALYFGSRSASLKAAKTFALLFGVVYLLLGIAGFVLGEPGAPTMPGLTHLSADSQYFRVIPGVLELGTMDHIVHILLGSVFLISALATRTHSDTPRTKTHGPAHA